MHAVIDWLETTSHDSCVSREFTLRDTPRLVSGTLWEPAAQANKTPVAGLVCLGHGAIWLLG
ncbi:MAG: hypothetical protein O3A63_11170, partial [Proteobacteria bacterium]|nr:hypothetical protein [Pseudomonadota bacterium]